MIHCIDPGIAPITATDILLYFYYGGLLSTGRRQYKQASELFLMAVTLPTGVTNAITVAALKKLILVSFIHGGEPLLKLPKHTSQPVLKALKSDCGPYTELVKIAMTSKDATAGSEIYNFVDSKADLWNADGNYGLIKLILDRIPQRRILALSRLYYTLELPRLAKIIGFENIKVVERKLMRMAETETNFHPSLSHRELGGVVEFSSDENCFTTGLTMSRLHELTSTCMELATSLSELDHSISCSKAYLSRSELTKGPVFNTQMSSDDFGGDELMTAAQL